MEKLEKILKKIKNLLLRILGSSNKIKAYEWMNERMGPVWENGRRMIWMNERMGPIWVDTHGPSSLGAYHMEYVSTCVEYFNAALRKRRSQSPAGSFFHIHTLITSPLDIDLVWPKWVFRRSLKGNIFFKKNYKILELLKFYPFSLLQKLSELIIRNLKSWRIFRLKEWLVKEYNCKSLTNKTHHNG